MIFRITVVTLLCACINLIAQDKKMYKGSHIYCNYFNPVTDSVISTQGVGKNVKITYDSFFKSWLIVFQDENNETAHIKLKYIQDDGNGGNKMSDEAGTEWVIVDLIKKDHIILLAPIITLSTGLQKSYRIEAVYPITKK